MTRPRLAIVPTGDLSKIRKPRSRPTPESIAKLADRAKRQARALSRDFADTLEAMATDAEALMTVESAPPGVREAARQMAQEARGRIALIRRLSA